MCRIRRHTRFGSALVALTFAVATASCVPAGAAQHTVEIDIRHSRFHPGRLSLPAGTTVTFVIRNTDPIEHEFILGDEAVQRRHETGTERRHGEVPGEVTVPAGQEAVTTVVLRSPGRLIFGCHLPGHYAYGMRGEVEVADR